MNDKEMLLTDGNSSTFDTLQEIMRDRIHERVLNGCTHYRGERIDKVFLWGFLTVDTDFHAHLYTWHPEMVDGENGQYEMQMMPREVEQ